MKKLFISIILILLIGGCATNSANSLDHGNLKEFTRSNSTTPHGYQIVSDPTGSAPLKMVERFEVRSGECSGGDCSIEGQTGSRVGSRERSEISTDRNNYSNSEYWYGWSIFVPKDHINVWPVNVTLGQFYNIDGAIDSPTCSSFMFQNSAGWGALRGGLTIDRHHRCATQEYVTILTDKELLGNWNKIEVHAKWSNLDDGFFEVYANGILKYSFKGKTTEGNGIYFKYGVYRSWVKRYLAPVPTQVVLYANVKRAKTREGLAP